VNEKPIVADLGEKRIIREIIRPACQNQAVDVGVGDDAAIIAFPPNRRLVISTDKIPEDLLAIQLGIMDAFHHGRYLATVNISDIAAMGAEPLGLLCTLALPNTFEVGYLKEFINGFVAGGAEWNVPVVGGDTGWGSSVCVSATAFGCIESGNALLRSGAQVGDRIFVSDDIGGFGAALAYFVVAKSRGLQLSQDEEHWLRDKLIRPIARVDVGRALFFSGLCTSCMDVTDGLGQSLRELAEASHACLLIDFELVPVHPITSKVASMLGCSLDKMVFGLGLDLQLLGTMSTRQSPEPLPGLRYFGEVVHGEPGVIVNYGARKGPLPIHGWQHFTGSAMEQVRRMYASD
jgi:thiamine-monophosphate kinase